MQKEEQELSKIPDFYIFNEHEIPFYEQFPTVTPDGPAGSLFLWDSRTAHAVRVTRCCQQASRPQVQRATDRLTSCLLTERVPRGVQRLQACGLHLLPAKGICHTG